MGGFAAFLGGGAGPVQDYNQRMTNLYAQSKQQMIDALLKRREQMRNPADVANIDKTLAEITSHQIGTPISSILNNIVKRFVPHPELQQVYSGVPGPIGPDHPTANGTPPQTPVPVSTGNAAAQIAPPPMVMQSAQPTPAPSDSGTMAYLMNGGSNAANGGNSAQATPPPPQPPVAALPATSPAQGSQGPIRVPPPQPSAPMSPPSLFGGLPEYRNPTDIANEVWAPYGPEITTAMREEALPILQQKLAANEETRKKRQDIETEYAAGQYALNAFRSSPEWPLLNPEYRMVVEGNAYGMKLPYPWQMMMPHAVGSKPANGTDIKKSDPNAVDILGQPIEDGVGNYQPINQDGHWGWMHIAPQTVMADTADGKGLFNKLSGQQVAPLPGSVHRAQFVPGPNGMLLATNPFGAYMNNGGVVPNAVSPPTAATISTGPRPVQTVDPATRLPVTTFVPMTTIHQKVGQGSVPAPAGSAGPAGSVNRVPNPGSSNNGTTQSPPAPRPLSQNNGTPPGSMTFSKASMSPQQLVTEQQKLKQYDIALERMQDLRGRLAALDAEHPGVLSSLMKDGALREMTNPNPGYVNAVINRLLPNDPNTTKIASDYMTMMEDINQIRGATGATSFRGPEAFQAMLTQRGNFLSNPQVALGVMDNTIGILNAQATPLREMLKHYGKVGGGNVPPPPPRNATGLENMSNQDLINLLGKP